MTCGSLLLMALFALGGPVAEAHTGAFNVPNPAVSDIGFDQNLGESVPLDLVFNDDEGKKIALASYFGEKPVLLAMAYFGCPHMCKMVIKAIMRSVKDMDLKPGRDFQIVVASINPKETPKLASEKKKIALQGAFDDTARAGTHFLTGSEASIKALAKSVGFRYRYDSQANEYAHPAGIVLLTSEGVVSRYLYGIDYPPRDLRLALVEASARKIGSPVDQFLLFCYRYDASHGRYGLAIMNLLRVFGVVTIIAMVSFFVGMSRWEKRKKLAEARRNQC